MHRKFEELDYQETGHGEISLRRRTRPGTDNDVLYEIKLGDEFLMSSQFTEAEVELARLALAELEGSGFDVVVGGLGLGYTAAAVLEYTAVRTLRVIELFQPVIDWHRSGLVPLGRKLCSDARCHLVQGDFFALAAPDGQGFEPGGTRPPVHAILLDIDHSPGHWLNPDNSRFYTRTGLAGLAAKLCPGGVFGLWSNDPPDEVFIQLLDDVFDSSGAHIIRFLNPYRDTESTNTVYLARTPC